MSEQVIAVLDAFCDKIGVAVDWTQANVFPYVQELMSRYIAYEIATSVLWCVLAAIGLGITYALFRKAHKCCPGTDVEYCACAAFIVLCVLSACVLCQQALDIVTCLTFPEKIFIELFKSMS